MLLVFRTTPWLTTWFLCHDKTIVLAVWPMYVPLSILFICAFESSHYHHDDSSACWSHWVKKLWCTWQPSWSSQVGLLLIASPLQVLLSYTTISHMVGRLRQQAQTKIACRFDHWRFENLNLNWTVAESQPFESALIEPVHFCGSRPMVIIFHHSSHLFTDDMSNLNGRD
jgi:hypothetical protein